MSTLKVTPETFNEMLLGLIKSGVVFEGVEKESWIVITFKGGF